mgnify:FL=1|jgi:hypothetical protein
MSRLVEVSGVHFREEGGWLNISREDQGVICVAQVPEKLSYVVVTEFQAHHLGPKRTVKMNP